MKARRFPFALVRVEDGITITMNCGSSVYRSRNVPPAFLRKLIRTCRDAQSLIMALRRKKSESLDALPHFPDCRTIAEGDLGPCSVRITASRGGHGGEFHVGFYDADDQEALALLLIDDQIDEFIAKAEAALAASPTETSET